jgi:hypothetical protein
MAFLDIEEIIESVFEVAYPRTPTGARAIKRLLAPAMGCLVIDPNIRQLSANRAYFKVDMADFLEYATSTLPPAPRLGTLKNDQVAFYEGFESQPAEAMLQVEQMGVGLSLLSAAIARNDVFGLDPTVVSSAAIWEKTA